MKSLGWSSLLLALVFVIGWKSSSLASRADVGPSMTSSQVGDSQRGSRRGRGPFGRGGSLLLSAEEFVDELGFTDAQREKLAAIMDDTSRRIREHEDHIWKLKLESRERVLGLLTDEQTERMREVLEERFRAHMEERVLAAVEWFRGQPELSADQIARVEEVLGEHESAKRSLYSGFFALDADETQPDHESFGRRKSELYRERDERLRSIVGEELVEKFGEQRRSGRRSRPHPGKDPHPGKGTRADLEP